MKIESKGNNYGGAQRSSLDDSLSEWVHLVTDWVILFMLLTDIRNYPTSWISKGTRLFPYKRGQMEICSYNCIIDQMFSNEIIDL